MIAVDYARRKRLKIWGHVRITEDPEVIDFLNGANGPRAERGIVIQVAANDWNCPQHIPVRRTEAERDGEVTRLRDRITSLQGELARQTAGPRELSD